MRSLNWLVDLILWAGVAVALWVLWSVQGYLLEGVRLAADLMHL